MKWKMQNNRENNKINSCVFLKKINKIDKFSLDLTKKKKGGKTQIISFRNEEGTLLLSVLGQAAITNWVAYKQQKFRVWEIRNQGASMGGLW